MFDSTIRRVKGGEYMAREWLKEARTKANLTQEEVAKGLDLTVSYYSLIEQGRRQNPMDLTLCSKLSNFFCIPILQIVENEAK